jgi:hypothetical protein
MQRIASYDRWRGLSPSDYPPFDVKLTRFVVDDWMSRTKMSSSPFVSQNRLVAFDSKRRTDRRARRRGEGAATAAYVVADFPPILR